MKAKNNSLTTEETGQSLKNWELSEEERLVIEVIHEEMVNIEEIYRDIKKKKPDVTLVRTMEMVLKLRMKKLIGERDGYYFLI